MSFGGEINNVANAIKRFYPRLRPIVRWFAPQMRSLAHHWRVGQRLLGDFIAAANKKSTEGMIKGEVNEKQSRLFAWFRDNIGRA